MTNRKRTLEAVSNIKKEEKKIGSINKFGATVLAAPTHLTKNTDQSARVLAHVARAIYSERS